MIVPKIFSRWKDQARYGGLPAIFMFAFFLAGVQTEGFEQAGENTLSPEALHALGFVFDDLRPICSIEGPDGPCGVEAFVVRESYPDEAAHTCGKLDRSAYIGTCRDGLLEGISVIFADGRAKQGRQAYISYFRGGRMAYPALISFLDLDDLNFGVREKGKSYGCVFFGKWDLRDTRDMCPRMADIYGSDIFTESNARDLKEGKFDLKLYSSRFLDYANVFPTRHARLGILQGGRYNQENP